MSRPVITVVGLGPGLIEGLTREAVQALLLNDKVFVRTIGHPVCRWLSDQGRQLIGFDHLYTMPWPDQTDIYEFIANALITEAPSRGPSCMAFQAVRWSPQTPPMICGAVELTRESTCKPSWAWVSSTSLSL